MSTTLRTLVLEDQPDDFKLLMHELRRAGFDPVGERVETAEEFLAHLDPNVDIIFSDYSMPGFNGLEALRLMKRRKLDIPFVFVSGTIGEEIAVAAMQEGAADYLMKDRLARLGPAVKKILAQWKLKEEKQLAEQTAARLAAIVESSSDAIIATTLDGIVVTWNTAAERLYGYESAEIVGQDISILVPSGRRQDDIVEDHQAMARRLRGGELIEAYETVRLRKNGRRVDVLVSISPIRDGAGVVIGASFIAHDISRRKRAERFLAAEHAVTRILAESLTLEDASATLLHALAECLRWEAAVLWKVDSDANVLRRMETWHAPWAESRFLDDLGQQTVLEPDVGIVGRAWARGEPTWEPCPAPPGDGQASKARLRAAISIPMRLQGQMVGAIEFYNPDLQQPDAAMLAALANIASQITQFSERRQNEIALKASEERYRTLVDATTAIVWGTPASGDFEAEQPEWTAFTGQTFDQLRGWGWLDAVHPEDRENTARVWRSAVAGRTVYEVEHRLRRADGEYRHMSVRAVPIFEPGAASRTGIPACPPADKSVCPTDKSVCSTEAVREWVGVHTDVTDKKSAEEAQRLLAAVVDSCEDAIICSDLDGTIRSWNGAAQRLFGYRADEIIGQIGLLVPSDLAADTSAKRGRVIQGESVPPFESERLRKGGERIPVSVSLSAVRNGGQIVALSTIFRDITDRKRVEATQALLAAVVDSSEDAILCTDLDGHVQSWNGAAERLFGYTAAEVIGRADFFVPSHLIAEVRERDKRLGRGELIAPFETVRLRKGGVPVPVSVSLSAVRVGGQIVAKSAIYRDITERKQAETTQALMAAVFDSSEDAVVCADLDGYVQSWNPAAERLFGYTAAEAIGRTGFLVPAHLREEARPFEERIRRGERVPPLETVRLRKGGEPVPVSIVWSPVRVGGEVVSKSAIYRDITPQKEAEAKLRKARAEAELHLGRLQAVFASMTEGVMVTGHAGNLLEWNAAARRLHGHDEMAEIYDPLAWFAAHFELRPPGGTPLATADRPLARVLRGETITEWELQLRNLDTGRESVVSYSGAPVRGADGSVELAVLTFHDITERKRAELDLRLFRALIDKTTDGIEVVDPATGRFLDVNESTCVTHGYTRAEMLTLGVPDVDPAVASLTWPGLIALGRFSEPQVFECIHLRKDGSRFPVEVSHDSVHLDREYIVAVVRDITERKRAEETLRASEARFRALVENSWDGVNLIDAAGTILYAAPATTRAVGFPLDEYVGRKAAEFDHPEDRGKIRAAFTRLAAEPGGAMTYVYRHRHRDGSWRWVEAVATNLLADPNVRAFVVNSRDITERRRAEEAVRASEERFRAFMDHSPALADIKDEQGRFLYVNAAWRRQFEHQPSDWLGKTNFDYWPRETADVFRASDEQCLARNAPVQVEELARTAAGDERTFLVMKVPFLDGGLRRIGGMAWDITDRTRAEAALRLRDRAIQAATQGLMITDSCQPDQPIIYASPGFERITGYRSEEALGRNCRFLQGKDTDPAVAAKLRAAIAAGEPCSVEVLNYRKDGASFWNELSISPVRDESGRLTHYVGVQADVTARRALEEQFHQAQKMDAFGQLAGGVAHDFNNLLTIINGYGEIVLNSLAPDDRARGFVTEILKAGERSAALTGQLLAFSRKQVVVFKTLDLNVVVQDTEKMLRRIIGEDIALVTSLAKDAGAVRGDVGQLEQVLLNLAVNARDAMPEGGKFVIETKNVTLEGADASRHDNARHGPYVLLAASDTGCGMTDEIKARIFEPFFTTKGVGKGTGLGLATVYGIVKQAEGHIEVHSELNVGTSFKIYLPRVNEAARPGSGSGLAQPIPRGSESILLVEDEDGLRGLLHEVLAELGYSVAPAANGMAALQMAKERNARFDLIVTDVVMPGMGGRFMVEQLVTLFPTVKVLYVSGYTDDAIVRHGIQHDQVPFLQKPFSPSALARKIREVLDS